MPDLKLAATIPENIITVKRVPLGHTVIFRSKNNYMKLWLQRYFTQGFTIDYMVYRLYGYTVNNIMSCVSQF